jgi:ariadne-1
VCACLSIYIQSNTIIRDKHTTEHGNGFYNCNRFDEKSSITARDAQEKSRAQLNRYLHYFNRYANHDQSAKLANQFYYRTEKKMEEMQLTTEFSWIEVQFMKKALQVVLDCRHTLTWTYALAYYLQPGNLTALFEDNQRDLEVAVEALNELIERPIPEADDPEQKQKMTDLKKQVVDKTEYCSRRREVLLEDTCRGLQEGRWEFVGL